MGQNFTKQFTPEDVVVKDINISPGSYQRYEPKFESRRHTGRPRTNSSDNVEQIVAGEPDEDDVIISR